MPNSAGQRKSSLALPSIASRKRNGLSSHSSKDINHGLSTSSSTNQTTSTAPSSKLTSYASSPSKSIPVLSGLSQVLPKLSLYSSTENGSNSGSGDSSPIKHISSLLVPDQPHPSIIPSPNTSAFAKFNQYSFQSVASPHKKFGHLVVSNALLDEAFSEDNKNQPPPNPDEVAPRKSRLKKGESTSRQKSKRSLSSKSSNSSEKSAGSGSSKRDKPRDSAFNLKDLNKPNDSISRVDSANPQPATSSSSSFLPPVKSLRDGERKHSIRSYGSSTGKTERNLVPSFKNLQDEDEDEDEEKDNTDTTFEDRMNAEQEKRDVERRNRVRKRREAKEKFLREEKERREQERLSINVNIAHSFPTPGIRATHEAAGEKQNPAAAETGLLDSSTPRKDYSFPTNLTPSTLTTSAEMKHHRRSVAAMFRASNHDSMEYMQWQLQSLAESDLANANWDTNIRDSSSEESSEDERMQHKARERKAREDRERENNMRKSGLLPMNSKGKEPLEPASELKDQQTRQKNVEWGWGMGGSSWNIDDDSLPSTKPQSKLHSPIKDEIESKQDFSTTNKFVSSFQERADNNSLDRRKHGQHSGNSESRHSLHQKTDKDLNIQGIQQLNSASSRRRSKNDARHDTDKEKLDKSNSQKRSSLTRPEDKAILVPPAKGAKAIRTKDQKKHDQPERIETEKERTLKALMDRANRASEAKSNDDHSKTPQSLTNSGNQLTNSQTHILSAGWSAQNSARTVKSLTESGNSLTSSGKIIHGSISGASLIAKADHEHIRNLKRVSSQTSRVSSPNGSNPQSPHRRTSLINSRLPLILAALSNPNSRPLTSRPQMINKISFDGFSMEDVDMDKDTFAITMDSSLTSTMKMHQPTHAILEYTFDEGDAEGDDAAELASTLTHFKMPAMQVAPQTATVLSCFLDDLRRLPPEQAHTLNAPPLSVHTLLPIEKQTENAEAQEEEVYEPSMDAILSYANCLCMDLPYDNDLLWIAREALLHPLPDPWKACYSGNIVYFVNFESRECTFSDPSDAYYSKLYTEEKEKKWQVIIEKEMQSGGLWKFGELNLNAHRLDDMGAQVLGEMIVGLGDISKEEDNGSITPSTHFSILDSFASSIPLFSLDLSSNSIADNGCASLTSALIASFHAPLHTLLMSHNLLTPHSGMVLSRYLCHAAHLMRLDLGHNHAFGNMGAENLARSLNQCTALRELSLNSCGLTDPGCEYVAEGLRAHPSIRYIDLTDNQIRINGLKAWGRTTLVTPTLTTLLLTHAHSANDSKHTNEIFYELQLLLLTNQENKKQIERSAVALLSAFHPRLGGNSGLSKVFGPALGYRNEPDEDESFTEEDTVGRVGRARLQLSAQQALVKLLGYL